MSSIHRPLSSASKIGIIGLGNVGRAIANNIINSELNLNAVFDIKPESMEGLPGKIAKMESPQDVAAASDVVLTALPTPVSVKAAMLGNKGAFSGLRQGSTWIDHSTTGNLLFLPLWRLCSDFNIVK